MAENTVHHGTNAMFVGLIGLAAGAVLMMLFTPRNGKEMREKLKHDANDLKEKAKENVDHMKEATNHGLERAKETKDEMARVFKETVRDAKSGPTQPV